MAVLDCGPCQLRPWRREDADALATQANSRAVWRGVRDRFPYPYTPELARAWLSQVTSQDPPTALAILERGAVVGGIGLELGTDVNRHTAEVGYWVGPAHWGQGLASAAVGAFLPWASETFGLQRFIGHVFSSNPASMRVLEKNGFVLEGVLRKHCLKDGRYLDDHVYGRLMHDFEA